MSNLVQEQVQVELKDGSVKEYASGTTLLDIAGSLSSSLKKNVVVGKINGKLVDLTTPVVENSKVELFTYEDEEGVDTLRHSSAHLMAQAVARLWPEVKFAIGPVIEDGFYYDFSGRSFHPEDLAKIEAEMAKIVKEDLPIRREEIGREAALKMFAERGDNFKVEIIQDLPEDVILSIYHQGEFTDLCTGPHLPSTGRTKIFKLLSIAGAYWRGNSDNEMLQRIYATAWPKQAQLDEYLHRLEEAKRRDHRRIGREQKLFTTAKEVGQGLPLWLPNGAKIRRAIERYIVDLEESLGYDHVYTPHLGSVELYKISGHWEHYQEDMYPPMEMDNESLVLRPMNCPHHMMVYKHDLHSYRDLPIRIAELGMMHRHESSGALSGLQRVRAMTLNDAHIFCRPDQIKIEFKKVVELIQRVYKDFKIDEYKFRLSYRDPKNTEKYFNDDEMWEKAQSMLKEAMDELGLSYFEAEGEAAFYGPKLDVQVKTAIGKEETLSTVQLDFLLPERFELEYVGEDGLKHRPVVIHRGILSTMERMTAHLIEVYEGAFPTWMAPVQAKVMTISQNQQEYAEQVVEYLRSQKIRVELDIRNEKIGYKIREAQMQKVPFMLVIGGAEAESGTVSVRKRGEGDKGSMVFEEATQLILDEIASKN
ncbi:threonine--tRNA ligase [Tumebacillus permanentifrigoris]|uniref:Threonine--tRNA ligase n=1 Tax=Tumebacillus permanentifrigoris TaxID=378543 RepID=A0A316DDU5_9BACL|nr:threonine--tRNA ligase [Tumebacillus permanentifrigoris]PWK15692.1 threonyl-tRNA synthetase [Tumebacillus permanentifrigoris]